MTARRASAAAAILVGLFAILWTQIPTLWAFKVEIEGRYPDAAFTRSMPTYADDTFTYYAWMRLAREGDVFFTDLYTTEPHPRNYVNVLFLVLGNVSRLTGLDPSMVHVLARPAFAALLLAALWLLAGHLFAAPLSRLACFVFFIAQGGWAGVADYFHRNFGTARVSSFEWWTPEISTLSSMVLFPHFLAGFLCMVGVVICACRAWKAERAGAARGWAVGAGLLLTAVTFFHPYDVVPVAGALWAGAAGVLLRGRRWPRREVATAAIATGVWLPSLLYNAWIFSLNPAMQAWNVQNVMTTPEWDRLVVGLGLGGTLAAASLFLVPRMTRPQLLVAGWFVSHLVSIHLPVTFQRRMIGGIQFPIAALSVLVLATWVAPPVAKLASRVRSVAALRRALGPAPLGLTVLAVALLLLPIRVATAQRVHRLEFGEVMAVRYPSWIRATEASALLALESRGGRDDAVLSGYELGGLVPPYAGRRTYMGHYALTIDAARKEEEIKRFYTEDGADDAWRRALLSGAGIRHVLWTAREREIGDFDPARRPWLVEVFRAGSSPEDLAVVYEVAPAPGASEYPASESPIP